MVSQQLAGSRVLIVEDEYFLADDAKSILSDVGAQVVGPVATVPDARALIEAEPALDGVLLDVNLRGEMAFELADTLQERGIPFAFVTGYDRAAMPERFADATSVTKPVGRDQLIELVEQLAGSNRR